MEIWLLVTLIIVCISIILKASLYTKNKKKLQLPPGPSNIPIIGGLYYPNAFTSELKPILRSLRSKFGPIVTIRFLARPFIFILDRSLVRQALVKNGALFASRPPQSKNKRLFGNKHDNINVSPYGPRWRLLRRNFKSELLQPSRIKSFSVSRKRVLDILVDRLQTNGGSGLEEPVKVADHFQYAMFCLLVLICFGDRVDENKIKEIADVQTTLLFKVSRFQLLNVWPTVTKILLRRQWDELNGSLEHRRNVLVPLINDRKESLNSNIATGDNNDRISSYVDTLLELEISKDEDPNTYDANINNSEKKKKTNKRKLSEEEIIPLCSEFLNAGTETTATALQWVMANLVKYPKIQDKLIDEIKGVVGEAAKEVPEEDLAKMPYLKAVVLEGLRRHPPAHYALPHAVTEEAELNGYHVPKDAVIYFFIPDIGRDPEVWENPMAFMPERFLKKTTSCDGEEHIELDSEIDVTCTKGEIKMMPFGAGRRICPGLDLGMLHVEYFVANLVWKFKWTAVDDVDLSEEEHSVGFTVAMKNPLHANISPRF